MSRHLSIIAAVHRSRAPRSGSMQKKLASALFLASIAACGGPIGDDQIETTDALYGVGSIARAWGNTDGAVVPTCWVNPDEHIDLQIRVRQILRETWESYANISFTGTEPSLPFGGLWASCANTPSRHVGVTFSEAADYRGNTAGGGANGALVTLIADRALDDNYKRFRYEVIHEFGHALGFAHEMQRPDNWNGDTAYQCGGDGTDSGNYARVTGGLYLTPTYDVNSIMNYCNPVGFPQDLSLGDISGVRAVCGRRDIKGVLCYTASIPITSCSGIVTTGAKTAAGRGPTALGTSSAPGGSSNNCSRARRATAFSTESIPTTTCVGIATRVGWTVAFDGSPAREISSAPVGISRRCSRAVTASSTESHRWCRPLCRPALARPTKATRHPAVSSNGIATTDGETVASIGRQAQGAPSAPDGAQ
jgi:hypothetical protein